MMDLTMLAFELADKYRNPVVILADGFLGLAMETVEMREPVATLPAKPWAITGGCQPAQEYYQLFRNGPG